MYSIQVDTHIHSVICEHAYSTIEENAKEAERKGLKGIAITDHGPKLSPFNNLFHFYNLDIVPKVFHNVRIYKGAELNILDDEGSVDLNESYLKRLDWVMAGFHNLWDYKLSEEFINNGYVKVLENPYIDCLSHIGQPKYKCDYELIVKKAKEFNKVIEINNNSFHIRPGSEENCLEVARLCKEMGVFITVSSDAHIATMIGDYDKAFDLISKVNFPKELIINRSLESFENYLAMKKGRLS